MRRRLRRAIKNGYGNIYTPHAGSMIIHVQREGGLANRTIVLSSRQVRLLRFLNSRAGRLLMGTFAATWLLFAVQTIRVPVLSGRVAQLERETVRIDTLQAALSKLHGRYEQVRRMLSEVTNGSSAVQSARGTTEHSAHSPARPGATPLQP